MQKEQYHQIAGTTNAARARSKERKVTAFDVLTSQLDGVPFALVQRFAGYSPGGGGWGWKGGGGGRDKRDRIGDALLNV